MKIMNKDKITFEAVHLEITNKEDSINFWTNIIGLQVRSIENGIEIETQLEKLIV